MTSQLRAAVWLDHQEARVFHVDLGGFDEKTLASPHRHVHRHPKGSTEARQHPDDLPRFFGALAHELAGAEQVLVVGPSTAKLQFVNYLHEHDRALGAKVVGLETVDHPTDAQLLAYVKHYFGVADPRVN